MRALLAAAGAMAMFATATHAQFSTEDFEEDTTGKHAGTYVCVSHAGAGVSYNKNSKRWVGSIFNVGSEKYVLKIAVDRRRLSEKSGRVVLGYRAAVASVGQPTVPCAAWGGRPIVTITKGGHLNCQHPHYDFSFNLGLGRFRAFFRHGYVLGDNANTPMVEIGKCSRIDTN